MLGAMDHIIQCWILADYEETKSLDLLSVCQCVRTDLCFLFLQAALESTRDSLAEELVKATTQVCFHILLSVCAVFKEISTTCTFHKHHSLKNWTSIFHKRMIFTGWQNLILCLVLKQHDGWFFSVNNYDQKPL